MRNSSAKWLCGICVFALATPALAQAGGKPAPAGNEAPAPNTVTADDIIVTAQKRSESVSRVGMAITALSGDALRTAGVSDVRDLVKIDPSFVVTNSTIGTPVYQIRGIAFNDVSLAASPTVSVYSDEVPYAFPRLTKAATFDLDRVEVLKGPQGTLYGQNATGGAVNYISAKPTSTFSAGADATYGRFGAASFDGFISGPITDTLKIRLALAGDRGGAWQQSRTRDDALGAKRDGKARLTVDWKPTNRLKVELTLSGFVDRSDTEAAQLIAVNYQKPSFASLFPQIAAEPLNPTNDRQADWYAGTHPKLDEHYYEVAGRITYNLADNVTATYLGAYEHYTQNDMNEPEGINTLYYYIQAGTVTANSQEVRLNGDLVQNRLHWLIGFDYARADTNETQTLDLGGSTTAYAFTQLPLALKPPQPALPPTAGLENTSTDTQISKAVFGNLEFHPTSTISLHAGARYNVLDIDHSGCSREQDAAGAAGFTITESNAKKGIGVVTVLPLQCYTLGANLNPELVTGTLDQSNVSWRVGADWTPTRNSLIYATISKGYKGGSFPTLSANSFTQLAPVVQESLVAYEIGLKSRFLGNRIEVTGAGFYYDYRNKQLATREPDPFNIFGLINELVNIPKSHEIGFEGTLKLRPMSGVLLGAEATYLKSRVDSDFNSYNPFSSTPLDFKGQPFPATPAWTLGANARYDWSLGGKYGAFVLVDGRYQSSSQGSFGDAAAIQQGYPSLFINPYAIMDLRAGVSSIDGRWRVEIFGNNVTNTYYWTQATKYGDAVIRYAGLPATYGVTLGFRY